MFRKFDIVYHSILTEIIEMNISGTHRSPWTGTLDSQGTLKFLKLEIHLVHFNTSLDKLLWAVFCARIFSTAFILAMQQPYAPFLSAQFAAIGKMSFSNLQAIHKSKQGANRRVYYKYYLLQQM